MCDPSGIGLAIAVGAATGAVGAAVTGQDVGRGALMGGVMGGATAGMGGLAGHGGTLFSGVGEAMNLSTAGILGTNVSAASLGGFAATGLVGSVATGMMFPQYEYPEYTNPQPIQAATAQNKVTGSGGTQASALLASEIKRVKRTRDKTQTSALNTQAFQTTGLQLA